MHRFVMALLVGLPAIASAESDAPPPPPRADHYVSLSVVGGKQRTFQFGAAFDGGLRFRESPLFFRFLITAGQSGRSGNGSLGDGGNFQQARVGVELRGCARGNGKTICGFFGADAGYQHDHPIDENNYGETIMETNAHDVLVVPRIGFEAGSVNMPIRIRLAAEVPLSVRLDEREANIGVTFMPGFGFAF
jgi:hypothetical protein